MICYYISVDIFTILQKVKDQYFSTVGSSLPELPLFKNKGSSVLVIENKIFLQIKTKKTTIILLQLFCY